MEFDPSRSRGFRSVAVAVAGVGASDGSVS